MKKYCTPVLQLLYFQEDIITTSPGTADFDDCFNDDNWS